MEYSVKVNVNGFKTVRFRGSPNKILSSEQKKNCAKNIVKSVLERNGIKVKNISVEGYY